VTPASSRLGLSEDHHDLGSRRQPELGRASWALRVLTEAVALRSFVLILTTFVRFNTQDKV
jgi:hypothetical protein